MPVDATIVAFTGQISEIKGIWEFIDAAEQLAARRAPATFAVLGDDLKNKGALRRKAEEAVAAKGLGAHVKFLGFKPDAPRLIPAFDLIAVPSHVEPLGNATLEAMAAERPVVGARVGGIPEMIVDGETGSLVPTRDATRRPKRCSCWVRSRSRTVAGTMPSSRSRTPPRSLAAAQYSAI